MNGSIERLRPCVTLRQAFIRRGRTWIHNGLGHKIRLNRTAYALLGQPEYMRIYVNRRRRCMSFEPCREQDPGAWRIRHWKDGAHIFLGYSRSYDIGTVDWDESGGVTSTFRRCPVSIEAGRLVLDLVGEGVPLT